MSDKFEICFNLLNRKGLDWRYYVTPTKSIMIVHKNNIKARGLFRMSLGFRVCAGACYLGSYIKDNESKGDWLKNQMDKWEENICQVTKTVEKNPQERFDVVEFTIQFEWIFLECITKDTI